MLVRVADWCYRRRGLVVICWTLVLLGSIALAGAFAGTITPNYLPPGTDSKAASQTLKRTFPQKAGSSLQIVVQADAGVTTPLMRARVERILNDVAREPHVVAVTNPFSATGSGQISQDGRTAYTEADLDQGHWRKSLHPDEFDAYLELWERSRLTGEPFDAEARFRASATWAELTDWVRLGR